MIFRIFLIVIALLAAYALYEIVGHHRYYAGLQSSPAEFTVQGTGNRNGITIVEFMNYDCGWCKDTHLVLLDYASRMPDVKLVVRPVPFGNNGAERAALLALAAGLQGKFWEMDRALSEYKGELDEKFYRESAAVYDIDYERMIEDAASPKILSIARKNATAVQKARFQSTPAIMVGTSRYQLDKPLTLTDLIRMVETEKRR